MIVKVTVLNYNRTFNTLWLQLEFELAYSEAKEQYFNYYTSETETTLNLSLVNNFYTLSWKNDEQVSLILIERLKKRIKWRDQNLERERVRERIIWRDQNLDKDRQWKESNGETKIWRERERVRERIIWRDQNLDKDRQWKESNGETKIWREREWEKESYGETKIWIKTDSEKNQMERPKFGERERVRERIVWRDQNLDKDRQWKESNGETEIWRERESERKNRMERPKFG